MRICDAIARQVAITKWNDIKEDLEEGSKVSIPLVLEQNLKNQSDFLVILILLPVWQYFINTDFFD
jgi:hypothetical protein